MTDFDVVIVGAGMVGAALAIGLAQQGKKVALLEGKAPLAFSPEQAMDVRVSAISQASVNLLTQLGAWSAVLDKRACPYQQLETWEYESCRTRFSSQSLGLDQLGFMVENRILQLSLWEQFNRYSHLTLLCPESFTELIQDKHQAVLKLSSGQSISTAWVIGADGAQSKVRAQAHIGLTAWDYRQHCLLISVATELPQQSITWQKFYPSGPRAFLPLAGQQACLVWYDNPQRIAQLSSMTPEQLTKEVMQHFPSQIGKVQVQRQAHFPLTRRHAHTYVKQRTVLIGDAAHTINPLAGQGVNLGFKDVDVLLQLSQGKHKLTQADFLAYQARRRSDNVMMQTAMDVFYFGFSQPCLPLSWLRNGALALADRSGKLKQKALAYALGL